MHQVTVVHQLPSQDPPPKNTILPYANGFGWSAFGGGYILDEPFGDDR